MIKIKKTISNSVLSSLILAIVTGCSTVNSPVSPIGQASNVKQNVNVEGSTLVSGKIDYQTGFKTKANLVDIATKSTVSLIDANNVTIVTGLSDTAGNFSINPNSSFLPGVGSMYRLEASRRLGVAGNDLMTLRTLLRWTGSKWESITTQGIYINYKTTALTLASSFENPTVSPASVINQIDTSTSASNLVNSPNFIVYNVATFNNTPDPRIVTRSSDGTGTPITLPNGGSPIGSVMINSTSNKTTFVVNDNDLYVSTVSGNNPFAGFTQITADGTANIETNPALSPDGTRVAFKNTANNVLVVRDVNNPGVNLVLTASNSLNNRPEWSPGGSLITYVHNGDIYTVNLSGNTARLTNTPGETEANPVFSADGTKVYFDSNGNIYSVDLNANNKTLLTSGMAATDFSELPSVSADGTKIAFVKSSLVQNAQSTVSTLVTSGLTLNMPFSGTFDLAGNLFIPDIGTNTIKKITPAGVVSIFAGSGTAGATDGTGAAASFNAPTNITFDKLSGNFFVADQANQKIRMITPAGVVTTIAGTGLTAPAATNGAGNVATFNNPTSIAIDNSGNLYVTDQTNGQIRKIANDTPRTVSTLASGLNTPTGIVIGADNNLYVSERFGSTIKQVTLAGNITTFAGNGTAGNTDGTGTAATFSEPYSLARDLAGNLYTVDFNTNTLRKIATDKVVTTIAAPAGLTGARGVTVDNFGTVYVSNTASNNIRKVSPAKTASNIYTVDSNAPTNLKQLTGFTNTTISSQITSSPTWNGNKIIFNETSLYKDILSVNSNVAQPVNTPGTTFGSDLFNITNNGATDLEAGKPYINSFVTNVITPAKFTTITDLVQTCITKNVDPLDYINYSGGTYSIVQPTGLNKMVFDNVPATVSLTTGTPTTYVFRTEPNKSYTVTLNSITGSSPAITVTGPGTTITNSPNNVTISPAGTSGTFSIMMSGTTGTFSLSVK